MKSIWNWFSGKKTIIGLIFAAVVTYLKMNGYIDESLAILLGTISGLIFAVGVGHKIEKRVKKTNKKQDKK